MRFYTHAELASARDCFPLNSALVHSVDAAMSRVQAIQYLAAKLIQFVGNSRQEMAAALRQAAERAGVALQSLPGLDGPSSYTSTS